MKFEKRANGGIN